MAATIVGVNLVLYIAHLNCLFDLVVYSSKVLCHLLGLDVEATNPWYKTHIKDA